MVFKGNITSPIINANTIKISTSSKVRGITINKNLTFEKQYSMSTKCLTQRMHMLKPFIYTGLNPATSRRILAQVIMPKALYGAFLWDYKTKIFLNAPIKLLLGTHCSPPSKSLHLLASIPPISLLYTKERLQLTRGLVKTNNLSMLSDTPRSTLTLKFKSDIRKLVHQTSKLTDIKPQDLSKRNINNCIQNKWLRKQLTTT